MRDEIPNFSLFIQICLNGDNNLVGVFKLSFNDDNIKIALFNELIKLNNFDILSKFKSFIPIGFIPANIEVAEDRIKELFNKKKRVRKETSQSSQLPAITVDPSEFFNSIRF